MTLEQFVAEVVRMYTDGEDNAFGAYKAAYLGPIEGESDLEFIRRCAEQDYHDHETGGCIYQDVLNAGVMPERIMSSYIEQGREPKQPLTVPAALPGAKPPGCSQHRFAQNHVADQCYFRGG